jgi:hypothetical protein
MTPWWAPLGAGTSPVQRILGDHELLGVGGITMIGLGVAIAATARRD